MSGVISKNVVVLQAAVQKLIDKMGYTRKRIYTEADIDAKTLRKFLQGDYSMDLRSILMLELAELKLWAEWHEKNSERRIRARAEGASL